MSDAQLATAIMAAPFVALSLIWLVGTTAISFWGDE